MQAWFNDGQPISQEYFINQMSGKLNFCLKWTSLRSKHSSTRRKFGSAARGKSTCTLGRRMSSMPCHPSPSHPNWVNHLTWLTQVRGAHLYPRALHLLPLPLAIAIALTLPLAITLLILLQVTLALPCSPSKNLLALGIAFVC